MRFFISMLVAMVTMITVTSPLSAAPTREMTSWDAGRNGISQTYFFGTYRLTLSSVRNDDQMAVPHLSVSAPGMPPIAYDGQAAGDVARADFTVLRLSAQEQPSVVFATYSGGAHCCVDVVVFQPADVAWRKIDLGSWDGGGIAAPEDVDGDGIVDFVFVDNAFLYTFDSYAGSRAPPLILNIAGGKAVNVSKSPRYAGVYRADMEEAKTSCAGHANGGCAAFVADAARIGQYDAAWKFMLANYDKTSTWTYPARCEGKIVMTRCQGRELKPSGFPQALQWFLDDNGYTAGIRAGR